VFCNNKRLGNANLDNLMSLVDLGKASPNTERTKYRFCKPCEISQCNFFLFCTLRRTKIHRLDISDVPPRQSRDVQLPL